MRDNPRALVNRRVDPPELVVATIDGAERRALLDYWQLRDDGRWWASVRFHTAPGMQYLRWTTAVRPLDRSPAAPGGAELDRDG